VKVKIQYGREAVYPAGSTAARHRDQTTGPTDASWRTQGKERGEKGGKRGKQTGKKIGHPVTIRKDPQKYLFCELGLQGQ